MHSLSVVHPVVISASARPQSHTCATVEALFGQLPTIHLCEKNIRPYSYDLPTDCDDFLPLMHHLVAYDPWIIATPVYWYTMSAQLKIFWDRCTDLLKHHRDVLNAMQGKRVLLVVSSHSGMPEEFSLPIQKTVEYLKMQWGGCWDYRFPLEKHEAYNKEQNTSASLYWNNLMAVTTPPSPSLDAASSPLTSH